MHSSRMRTSRLRIVPGGREVLSRGGGVVTWSQGGGRCCPEVGGRCCDLVPGGREVLWPGPRGSEVLWPGPRGWGRGGRCCDLVPVGREVLSRDGGRCCDLVPGGEGGVVTWSWGGGRCCDLVLRGGRCCPGGREVLWPGPGGEEGGVVTCDFGVAHTHPHPRWTEWVTHACENITFATRGVKMWRKRVCTSRNCTH